jgi:hypothetical protein
VPEQTACFRMLLRTPAWAYWGVKHLQSLDASVPVQHRNCCCSFSACELQQHYLALPSNTAIASVAVCERAVWFGATLHGCRLLVAAQACVSLTWRQCSRRSQWSWGQARRG